MATIVPKHEGATACGTFGKYTLLVHRGPIEWAKVLSHITFTFAHVNMSRDRRYRAQLRVCALLVSFGGSKGPGILIHLF